MESKRVKEINKHLKINKQIIQDLEKAASRTEAYATLNNAIAKIPQSRRVNDIGFIFNNYKFQSCSTPITDKLDVGAISRETNQDVLKVIPIKNCSMSVIVSRLKE